MNKKIYTAIGLMSGTSLDGIDAALIRTDGHNFVEPLDFITEPYGEDTRTALRSCFGETDITQPHIQKAETLLTELHANLCKKLLDKNGQNTDLIGFHGQTLYHNIGQKQTIQIGNGALLAQKTGIPVVNDFRSNDVLAGGQGAPLVPIYHRVRVSSHTPDIPKPVAVINIGGVGNITWTGDDEDDILAFDTGPGNALMDDLVLQRTGASYDKDGKLAAKGTADKVLLEKWLSHTYFSQKPPKSLDRNEWDIADLGPLSKQLESHSTEDALATLLEFSARSVELSLNHLPEAPKAWHVCGGGRHNLALMKRLQELLKVPVENVESLGWNGDAIEAECFAYLAARSVLGFPYSFPSTTGVHKPLSGGILHKP